jgi:2-desacetyl-2-hydroxyethyl bacteriochlorophyllide A dehydrogenase
MRAISLEVPGKFKYIDIEDAPSPGPGQALLKTHCMGVCGTDIGGYLGKFPFFTYPKIIGHELGVEVLAIGEGVSHLKVGDRCSVEPYMNCGHCYACRRGFSNCCQTNQTLGVMTDGGLCERFVLRADKVHPSRSLSYEQLALVETLAIGCHAVDRGECCGDDTVLVIGAGPIGLAVIEFARLTGARVIVMDMVASRLNFVERTYNISEHIQFANPEKALEEVNQLTHGDRCSLVIDATGNAHSMGAAVAYVAQTGTLVYVGISNQEISFPHGTFHKPEMSLKASRNAMPGDFARIIRLIENGLINTDPWITHRTTFDKMAEDFPVFTQPSSGVIKAIVEVNL